MGLVEGAFDGKIDGDCLGVEVALVEGALDGRFDGD